MRNFYNHKLYKINTISKLLIKVRDDLHLLFPKTTLINFFFFFSKIPLNSSFMSSVCNLPYTYSKPKP